MKDHRINRRQFAIQTGRGRVDDHIITLFKLFERLRLYLTISGHTLSELLRFRNGTIRDGNRGGLLIE